MIRPLVSAYFAAAVLLSAGCGGSKSPSEPTPPPPPPPTVTTVTITTGAVSLASIGESATLNAEVRLSNGSVGTQTVTWSSSNTAVATVAGNTVTAVGNGQATITASVGTVQGTATVTVLQVAVAISLLPADTVIKGPFKLRGRVNDARGNQVTGATLQWTTLSPTIDGVNADGNLTPIKTGVARIKVESGALNATVIVRTVWNVQVLADLFPLFEYTNAVGARRAFGDVNQANADLRGSVLGQVWTYLSGILSASGSPSTDMYFTTWRPIWSEFIRFCGGLDLPNQTAWTKCNAPNAQHFFVSETAPGDYNLISRFLTQQFMFASNTAASQFPWFVEALSGWYSGGSVANSQITGGVGSASIADFKTGDTGNILETLDALFVVTFVDYYQNIALRTPVAVRNAQGVMLMSYLNSAFPNVLPGLLAQIKANPGAGMNNAAIVQYILTQTGKTSLQLQTAYLAHARTF